MKKQNLKITTLAIALSVVGMFTSCEQEETLLNEETTVKVKEEVSPELSARAPFLSGVSRYFQGGGNSLHTYRVSRVGANVGSREGVPFKLGIYNKAVTATPPSGTTQLFFLLSPGNRDFLLTTNVGERNTLLRQRWRNVSEYNLYEREDPRRRILILNESSYIHTSGGSGRVKLYRFYGASNTDHLFTTNYQEGINAGYIYEGVTGWVHR